MPPASPTYDTRGIVLDRRQIEAMEAQSYWEQRTFRAFETSVEARLSGDVEERDAVLSVLWRFLPTMAQHRVMVVPIPARAPPSSALLYRFTFDPPVARGRRSRVRIEFVTSGAGSTPREALPAPPAYVPGRPGMTFCGFPEAVDSDPSDAYFASHPAEHRALFRWLETEAPPIFDQIITTSDHGAETHRSVFHVTGNRAVRSGALSHLRIDLVADGFIEPPESPPDGYRSHDLGDLELEVLQARPIALDRLGPVTLDATVPPGERNSVKEAILQYFDAGGARDMDVHAIVPSGVSATALYELSFRTNNAVNVTRVGAVGTGPGQVDTQRIDVTRVHGFPGTTATSSALRTWWRRRYPACGPQDDAPRREGPADLIARMSERLSSAIASPGWFERNYGVVILDAAATAARLVSAHGVPCELTLDTIALDATDQRMLELSLETLTHAELQGLRGVQIGRKTSSIAWTEGAYRAGAATQCGATLTETIGAERRTTVLYFQSLYENNASLFRGTTAADALPDVVMSILHELGHALSEDGELGAAFQAWIRLHPQTAPTWYAASAPETELFPEAFALYHTEPTFLLRHDPLLHAWLEELARTGRPPRPLASSRA